MLIKDWMTKDVVSVDKNTSVLKALRMMREKNVRRFPVIAHGKLVGIVTDRDLKEASPSCSSTPDIHELNYLLSEMPIKEVMTPDPVCISLEDLLEKAAVVMLKKKISGLPVVDDAGHLVGMLSESDVLRGFIHATGIQEGAALFILEVADQAGATSRIVETVRQQEARLVSILTSYQDANAGMKRVSLRITGPEERLSVIFEQLAADCRIIYYAMDDLESLPEEK